MEVNLINQWLSYSMHTKLPVMLFASSLQGRSWVEVQARDRTFLTTWETLTGGSCVRETHDEEH